MNQLKAEKELNKNGKPQGMHPNSRVNLARRWVGNNHAKKEFSITRIQREMMGEICPYAKDPTWTWAYALAEAGMKDALTQEHARENLKDRLEGERTTPTIVILEVRYVNRDRGTQDRDRIASSLFTSN